MIIPVRCFTCGKVLADKWATYQKKIKEMEKQAKKANEDELHPNFDKNLTGGVLDDLGLDRICCRRHMLTHVDLIDII